MELKALISKLHPLERKVLPVLKKETELSKIVKSSGMQEIEVMRALQWLDNKKVLTLNIEKKKVVDLDKNGKEYQKKCLPERKFLETLSDEFITLSELSAKTKLNKEELNACIGLLRKKVAIEIKKEQELMIKLGPQSQKLLKEGSFEEQFLKKKFPVDFDSIKDIEKLAFEELKKRKDILKVEEVKQTTITLTDLGKDLLKEDLSGEYLNRLTPGMLKTGSWQKKDFRAYDVEINVPKVHSGKKHFVNDALEYAKNVWIELGFKEMTGNMTTTSFWCFDALFTPQDHPVREMQDTFYLEKPFEKGKLPSSKIVEKIKAVHENGGDTDSKGWQYNWNPEEAGKTLMRTHTTILTAQNLAKLKNEDLPVKLFAIGKCFRNETLDWSHLFEFNQTEGIVIDENVNFKHLLGYLREFAKKMGYPKVRFRPAFFAYTEPSVEGDVYDPVRKKWIEFIAAGMLRPEVVKPLLGVEVPVLAWGPGIDRIIMGGYKITDLRDLYKNDLKQIREMKAWLK